MRYIKDNLILFQLGICLLIGGLYTLFNSKLNLTSISLIALLASVIGVVILWRGFILKIIRDKKSFGESR